MKMDPIVLDQLTLADNPSSRLWFLDRISGSEQETVFTQLTPFGAGITVAINVKTINPSNTHFLIDPKRKFKITIEEIES